MEDNRIKEELDSSEARHGFSFLQELRKSHPKKEQAFWFVRQKKNLRREISVWRFRLSPAEIRFTWRLGVTIGNGPLGERQGLHTWTSPKEYEIFSRRLAEEGLTLSFIKCRSEECVLAGIETYFSYRRRYEAEMVEDCWRGFASLLRDENYLEKFQVLNKESKFLSSAANLERKTILNLKNTMRETECDWKLFAPKKKSEENKRRYWCGISAIVVLFGRQEYIDRGDAHTAYNLGVLWFENPENQKLLEKEMRSLVALT